MKTKIVIAIILLPGLAFLLFIGKGFYENPKESWVAIGIEQGKEEGIELARDELIISTVLNDFREQGKNGAINKIFDEIEARGEVRMSRTASGVQQNMTLVEK